MARSPVLLVDAAINLALGILLIPFPLTLIRLFGMPSVESAFYPSILGAVLFGIGLALLLEYLRGPTGMIGLGLGGAVSINLCGGVALAAWLLIGKLGIPARGQLLLWALVFTLVAVSGAELVIHNRQKRLMRG